MNKKLICIFSMVLFSILLLLLAGCVIQQAPKDTSQQPTSDSVNPTSDSVEPVANPQASQPSSAQTSGTTLPTPESAAQTSLTTSQKESDGNSGSDAPDRFQDGQVELKPGEYTENALIRNDDFDQTSNDIDFYKFKIGAGDWFKLTLTPVADLDAQILIHDEGGKDKTWDYTYYYVGNPAGQAVFKLNSGIAGKEESFWSQMSTEQETYIYYFSVSSVKGIGAYTLQLETKSQNDGNAGKDAGEKPAKAISLDAGKEYPGLLNYNDRVDCYKLSTTGKATVTVTPTEKLDLSFTVHDEGGKDKTWSLTYYKKTDKKEGQFKVNNADAGLPESITWETTASTQYICVKQENGFGDYTIKYS